MKIHLPWLCLLMTALPSPALAQKIPANLVSKAQNTLQELKIASGTFMQLDPNNVSSSGRFYLRRPGKVRFEYTHNNPVLIVSDGTTIAIQNKQLKTFDRIPLSATPLSLFLGKNIRLEQPGLIRDIQTSEKHHYITLQDPDNKIEGSLTLVFSKTGFKLLGWLTRDASNRTTRILLKKIETPAKLPASLFRIHDPEDMDDRNR